MNYSIESNCLEQSIVNTISWISEKSSQGQLMTSGQHQLVISAMGMSC